MKPKKTLPVTALPDFYLTWLTQPTDPERLAVLNQAIGDRLLVESTHLRESNFQAINPADLQLLFRLYDEMVFSGHLRQILEARSSPLTFKLSRRLTRTAGTTAAFRPPRREPAQPAVSYQIAISLPLLGQSFGDVERIVHVTGLVCHNRVEALRRIFEHELLHLAELLVLGRSSCSARPFRSLARNLFGHTETRHNLITQRERAEVQFSIRVGDRVCFDFEGQRLVGVVNRITRRATILVENPAGQRYSNGRHYQKFYVPLRELRKDHFYQD
jgi:hypothetical protein